VGTQRRGTGSFVVVLVALVWAGISGKPAEAQGLPVHQERGMEVFLVACDGRTDPATATVVVELKSDELRREAAVQLEALAVAPEEAAAVTRRVSTFLFGDGGSRWQIAREIFVNDAGQGIAATENKEQSQWLDVKPGGLPGKIWEAVQTMQRSGVVLAVPPGLYLPSGSASSQGLSQEERPPWVDYRDDRVYSIFLEDGRYVWAELDRSECLMRQSATKAPRALEAMDRVQSFALAAHLGDGRWKITLFGENFEKVFLCADEKAFLAMERVLREGLERRRRGRAHGSSSTTEILATGAWGEGTAEMGLCRAGSGMNEEELLEVRWTGGAGEGRLVGATEALRYLADHMSLARSRWKRQQGELRRFLENRETLTQEGPLL